MIKKRELLLCILSSAALAAGCEDATSGSAGISGGTECSESTPCQEGTCISGVCTVLANKGEACNVLKPCADSLVCAGNICKLAGSTGGSCTPEDTQCPDGQSCFNGKCQIIAAKDESCSEANTACAKGLICFNGTCIDDNDYYPCTKDEDCTEVGADFVCLSDKACGKRVGIGVHCKAEHIECEEGLVCEYNYCTKLNEENEKCDMPQYDQDQLYFCQNGLDCIDGICHSPIAGIARGKECNDKWLICADGLKCTNDRCTEYAEETMPCNPDEYIECRIEGNQCIKNICTPVGNACISNDDCRETDSHCCLTDACGAKGFCIPFDEDITYDNQCLFKTKPGIFEAQIQCRWQPTDVPDPKGKACEADKDCADNHEYTKCINKVCTFPVLQHTSASVEMPPLVGHFGNKRNLDSTVAFYSYASGSQSLSPSASHNSVIRFIDPESCETLESISVPLAGRWFNYPAAIDIDNDGLLEFLAVLSGGNIAAYKWNAETQSHTQIWRAAVTGGAAIEAFDINLDGETEIISGTNVISNQGKILTSGANTYGRTFSLGYMKDSKNQTFAFQARGDGLYKFEKSDNTWTKLAAFAGTSGYSNNWNGTGGHTAYADFGTPGDSADSFNFKKLDGIPEFIIAGTGMFRVYAVISNKAEPESYTVQQILNISLLKAAEGTAAQGGPITVGDFDNDGLPEIGLASTGYFGVYDPLCQGYEKGKCADKYVLWERWSQDASSGTTGSSLFDFDGDGQAEAVYADECFTRVYDGQTGAVLFSSARSSVTSIEGPVVADIDGDGSTEILMGSDGSYACYSDGSSQKTYPAIDPIHEGIRCEDDEDCPTSKNCDKTIGLCLCTSDSDCNVQYLNGTLVKQYACTAPIHKDVGLMRNEGGTQRKLVKTRGSRPDGYDAAAGYKVCRAYRNSSDTKSPGRSDLMILKDRLDRWVSSRNIWNQHAYNIINIEDSGKVPTASQWELNWKLKQADKTIAGSTDLRPLYNNYRLNKQGKYGAGTVPDITGRFIKGALCGKTDDGRFVISGKLCNRGTKPVAMNLPATFYNYDESAPDKKGSILCTSLTNTPVGIGQCDQVGCSISEDVFKSLAGKKVIMSTNVDSYGQPTTVECRYDNNDDTITIDKCEEQIIIAN